MRIPALLLCALLASASCAAQRLNHYVLPDKHGAFEIDLSEWSIVEAQVEPQGRQIKITAQKRDNDGMMTLWLEPAKKAGDGKTVRKEWWPPQEANERNMGFDVKDVKLSDNGPVSLVQYTIPLKFQGQTVNHGNVRAYYADGEVWVEMHLSMTPFTPEKQDKFDRVLNSVKLLPDAMPTSADYLGLASAIYGQKEYKQAARRYQQAIDLNAEDKRLNDTMWKVAVDNLAMSYGISGDLERAKKTLETGIQAKPDYPMFHYILADTYAEKGDRDAAIASLERAFSLRKNLIAGERMPDPMTDDSFKRFWRDPKFVAAVEKLPK